MDKDEVYAMENVHECYAEVCDHMWEGIICAVRYNEDFEFDEKLIRKFEEAVNDLALNDCIANSP